MPHLSLPGPTRLRRPDHLPLRFPACPPDPLPTLDYAKPRHHPSPAVPAAACFTAGALLGAAVTFAITLLLLNSGYSQAAVLTSLFLCLFLGGIDFGLAVLAAAARTRRLGSHNAAFHVPSTVTTGFFQVPLFAATYYFAAKLNSPATFIVAFFLLLAYPFIVPRLLLRPRHPDTP